MKISEFLEKVQEFGDIEVALADADTDLIQAFDAVLTENTQLFVETPDNQRYCVIPCARYGADFL